RNVSFCRYSAIRALAAAITALELLLTSHSSFCQSMEVCCHLRYGLARPSVHRHAAWHAQEIVALFVIRVGAQRTSAQEQRDACAIFLLVVVVPPERMVKVVRHLCR